MDLGCLQQIVSISRLIDHQESGNICVLCKYYYFSLRKYCSNFVGRSNAKLTHFVMKNRDPSKLWKIFDLKVHMTKYICIWNI